MLIYYFTCHSNILDIGDDINGTSRYLMSIMYTEYITQIIIAIQNDIQKLQSSNFDIILLCMMRCKYCIHSSLCITNIMNAEIHASITDVVSIVMNMKLYNLILIRRMASLSTGCLFAVNHIYQIYFLHCHTFC